MAAQPRTHDDDGDTSGSESVQPGQDPKRAESWVYGHARLPPAPVRLTQEMTATEMTSYYLQQVLDSSFGDCQRILASYMPELVCTASDIIWSDMY